MNMVAARVGAQQEERALTTGAHTGGQKEPSTATGNTGRTKRIGMRKRVSGGTDSTAGGIDTSEKEEKGYSRHSGRMPLVGVHWQRVMKNDEQQPEQAPAGALESMDVNRDMMQPQQKVGGRSDASAQRALHPYAIEVSKVGYELYEEGEGGHPQRVVQVAHAWPTHGESKRSATTPRKNRGTRRPQ